MADLRKNGATSNLLRLVLKNSSTGVPLTGLTFSSAGLIISTVADNEASATAYTQAGSTIETITTLGTFAAPTATKCRFKEVDATNHPGLYEIQIADARFAVSNAKRLIVSVSGAASLLATDYEIQLVSVDHYDGVRYGMTALPNAAAEAAGGLYTRGTGAGQIRQDANGRIDANAKAWIDGTIPAVNVTGVPKVDLVDWLGSAPDVLSSGKLPADLKLWLASAPAALSTNGYVQAMLLRWLTDNAGGTPNALVSGDAPANVKQLLGTAWLTPGVAGTPDVNAKLLGGTAQTGRDLGASVLVGDKTGFSLSAGGVQAIWDALTSALTTVGSVGKRIADFLTGDAYARIGAGGAGLTALGDARIANLDAAVSSRGTGDATAANQTTINNNVLSRLATSGYTAPDNASITAIKAKTDNLPASPAAVGSAMTLAAGAITAAVVATDAIDADALATDAVAEIAAKITTDHGSGSYVDSGTPPTAAAISTQVNADLTTAHGTGSYGGTGSAPTADENVLALLDKALTGHITPGTVGEALYGARAQALGKWVITANVLTLYAPDGTTVVQAFTLSPSGGPYTTRTPQ